MTIQNTSDYPQSFRDTEYKNYHWYRVGAPCEWSAERGATHTLVLDGDNGSRPLKLLKTVAYVGIDEDENGNIVWEKWSVTK
jgi:hypothetical protein